jgi:plastocyanin
MKNRFYLLLLVTVFTFFSAAKATNHVITVVGSYPNFAYSIGASTEGGGDTVEHPFAVNVGDSVTWSENFNEHPLVSLSVPGGAASFSHGDAVSEQSLFTYVVTTQGTYLFHCAVHLFQGSFTASAASGVQTINAFPTLVSVYPTVARDVVNLNVKDGFSSNKKMNVEVYNVLGNKVINFDFLSGNTTQINVADLAKGIYFVAIKEDNTVLGVQKIIKQ